MSVSKVVVFVCFLALLAVPLLFQPSASPLPADALKLIIITPHNEQIRTEFAAAFDRWHEEHYGERVHVQWSVPGGTSEIRRMLESQFISAFETGRQPGGDADLIFGGGSYEHMMLKRGVTIMRNGETHQEPITQKLPFTDAWLEDVYGPNTIGDAVLYDPPPETHWLGTALSGFGIVYNRDTLRDLGVNDPETWEDLCSPDLAGWVALVNPGQSGSITTAFDTILQRRGWEHGWRILRRAGANSRYFSASAGKVPRDVSYGDAAIGVCIDFYGRYQAQAILDSGGGDRVGYIDPVGATTIDPDPISMLRGAPNPELAERFIKFTLTEQAQALWQFRKDDAVGDGLGPQQFELRRLPVLRSMYAKHMDRMIDQVNPFSIAAPVEANPDFRVFVSVLFAAMAMDTHADLKRAWKVIIEHPAYPRPSGSGVDDGTPLIVTAEDVEDRTLREMLRLFDAMPEIAGPDGASYRMDQVENLAIVRDGWLRRAWAGDGLWHPEAAPADEMRRRFVDFFRGNYRRIVDLAE